MLAADGRRAAVTARGLLAEVASVVSRRQAWRVVTRARRLAGVGEDEALGRIEVLMLLESIAAEGGVLQVLAERLARRTLAEGERGG
ncbi:MAG: hypothetical protein M0R75_03690 [Dehalococcoidia bacterium]|nr:hypothetical protein [Dehalococcoidia bacterium]